MSLYRSIANIPFRSFWLGTNVTLDYFYPKKIFGELSKLK